MNVKNYVPNFLPMLAVASLSLLAGACDDAEVDNGGGGGGGAGGSSTDAESPLCDDGARACTDDGRPRLCEAGAWADQAPCAAGQRCEAGDCVADRLCEPGASRCRNDSVLEVCDDEGAEWAGSPCEGRCSEQDGVAACADQACVPGEKLCNDSQTVVQCNAAGTRLDFVERCNGARTGKECSRGECVPICILTEKLKTNVGCDYWAVDLDNAFVPGGERGFLDAAGAPYAVVVSNPHPDFTSEVRVLDHEGQVDHAIVPPLGLHVFFLEDGDVDGTVQAKRAFRVRSSIPIVAYQFNPLDNEDVFSNDASLLLPSHVVGDEYYVMTREQSFDRLRGYLTVVGINEEPTQVEIKVTARTQPGVGGIPALQPGETFVATLEQFDVLNIETHAPGADLTGSYIKASRDVVVFGGSEAANAPNTNHCVDIDAVTGMGVCEYKRDEPCRDNYDCNEAGLNTCCADHLEEQLFPVKAWRQHYVATKSFDRGQEDDYWRILAAEDDTKIETVPPQVPIPTLNAGEWFEFGSREHFEIISDKPVLVGQFLASEQAPDPNLRNIHEPGDAGTGDPAFILAVPVDQFRSEYVFLAPDKYAFDYVSIIAAVGSEVFFDELPIPTEWEPVGSGAEWQVARFVIGDGVHFIQSDQPVGVIVYGYDQYVSYGYPGGLNLDVDGETGEEPPPPPPPPPPGPDAGPPAEDMGVPAPDAAPPAPDAGPDEGGGDAGVDE